MTPFTFDQWVMAGLIFLLGLLIGMFMASGGKWKRAYREEVARVRELESENQRLHKNAREMDSLRNAAARTPPRAADEPPPVRRADADRY